MAHPRQGSHGPSRETKALALVKDPVQLGTVAVGEILTYLESDRYLRKRGAADYMGVSRRKLDQLLPRMPHYRVDGMILLRKSEIDGWMAMNKIDPQEDLDAIVDDVLGRLKGGNHESR